MSDAAPTALTIEVTFSLRRLLGGNHGLDAAASAARYADALTVAIAHEFPGGRIRVEGCAEESASVRVSVHGASEPTASAIVRGVEDLAWVVRQCSPWSVPG